LLQGAIVNGICADAVVAPGGVTVTALELAHCVSLPVGTSEYSNVNSACWPEVSVTTDGGWVGGPERFTVRPFTTVIGTVAPDELKRASAGYPSMVHVALPTGANVMVPTMVPAAPCDCPGVAVTCAQAAMPVVVVVVAAVVVDVTLVLCVVVVVR
jgi:hypothetical protein